MGNQVNQGRDLASIVVVAIFLVPLASTRVASRIQYPLGFSHEPQKSRQKVHFKITAVGEVRDKDGTHLTITAFETDEGVKLTMTHHRFDSAVESEQFLSVQISRAVKIVKQTQRKDSAGRILGQRAEIV